MLDRPRPPAAAARARAALDRFVVAKLPHDEALARAVLVRALLRQGSVDDAAHEADALDTALARCEVFDARIESGLARAELAAARGERDEAARAARETRQAAEGSGIVPLTLEARLVEASVTRDAPGLARLAQDARTGGYLRVARLSRR
jgi:hypothetical protein